MSKIKKNSNGVKNSSSLAVKAVNDGKKLTVVQKGVCEREYFMDDNPKRVVVEDVYDYETEKTYLNFYHADTTNVTSNHLEFIYGIRKDLINEERIVMEIMNGEWDNVL